IRARSVPLVFPKIHDCIALFLGSDQAYREQFAKFPGTFYISSGWYQEKERPRLEKDNDRQIWVGSRSMGYRELEEKYGAEESRDIIDFFSSWKANYQRAVFIDTGVDRSKVYEQHARKMAEENGWQYETIEGGLGLLSKLLTVTSSDRQLLIVPPGHVTVYSAINNCLDSAPAVKNKQATESSKNRPRYLYFGGNREKQETAGRDPGSTGNDSLRHKFGLGVDAGGTYTDAVIYNFSDGSVVSKKKALTTKWDFTIGIDAALAGFDQKMLTRIDLVSVSTTLATNAIVEGEGQKAGMLFMPGPGAACEILSSRAPSAEISGQLSISGKEIQAVNRKQVLDVARVMVEREGVTAFAVSGFGGSVNPLHELQVKDILTEAFGMVVCCGHELSDQLNLVVRAQTALLNARIIPRMMKFFRELESVLTSREIQAPVMVVKGDGTLISVGMATERPVETILSGPAASVAGAKLLTGLEHALVVDIGGTTTDTGNLENGLVMIRNTGAKVGGISTHVKALDMRTVGLGGDSLIRFVKSELQLGPGRVAPVSWASTRNQSGMDKALHYMEKRVSTGRRSNLSQVLLVSSERGDTEAPLFPFEPTRQEFELFELLCRRPYSLEELAKRLGLSSYRFLESRRLEELGLVQRCGLTPTDILHLEGSFVQWHKEAAKRMVSILAQCWNHDPADLIRLVRQRFENALARELVLKHLSEDVEVPEKTDSRLLEHLMQCMLGKKGKTCKVQARFDHPVVGIGAPAPYFLPAACRMFEAEVVIPEDGDVANALGAITSNIVIREKLEIRPAQTGGFLLQGLAGENHFNDIDEAEEMAIEHLLNNISSKARKAGTDSDEVEMVIEDNIVDTADGISLFLERSISATLVGRPGFCVTETNSN
ncbi:MAG: hydantoinase/oxoprolinase family protein, partial [Desulfocapsaceae bacterium]|nr:hydantoinase/oxoprolinase family protein [Desulfocapsaceae bacterium]